MKTAVEWLMEINIKQNGIITAADYHTAKEMEKQQIIEAVKSTDYIIGATNKESEEFAQQYYNETYKSE